MDEKPVALITAGSGAIGGACARELVARGYRVALLSNGGGAVKLAAEIGDAAVGLTGSVTDAADLAEAVELAVTRFGRLDAVVNNTGHTRSVKTGELLWDRKYQGRTFLPEDRDDFMLDVADEDWHAALDLLFLSVVRIARLTTPVLRRAGGGAIVNISSYVAREPSLALPVGSSLRAALTSFTKLYADRYSREGIRMNTVLPGHVANWPGTDKVTPIIPLGRSASPVEVAKTVAFLLSADAGYITGQSILVDGEKIVRLDEPQRLAEPRRAAPVLPPSATSPPAIARSSLTGDGFICGPLFYQRISVDFALSGVEMERAIEALRAVVEPGSTGTLTKLSPFLAKLKARAPAWYAEIEAPAEVFAPAPGTAAPPEASAAEAPATAGAQNATAAATPVPTFAARAMPAACARPDLIVITGFLGSGKTTLVNALLREPAMARTLVFINEIGATPVDHLAVRAMSGPQDIILLANGCLCCAFGNELIESLRTAVTGRDAGQVPWFDRIIVETSGAADPIGVVERLQHDRGLRERIRYRGTCTTIDAISFAFARERAPEVNRQLDAADWVMVTKSDLVDPEELPGILSIVQAAAGAAVHIPRDVAQAARLLAAEIGRSDPRATPDFRPVPPALPQPRARAAAAMHDGALGVVNIERGAVDSLGLRLFCDLLIVAKGDDLYRMKGRIALRDQPQPLLMQGVRSSIHELVWLDPGWASTQLTIIGRNLDAAGIEELFDSLQSCLGISRAAAADATAPAGSLRPC